MKTIRIAAVVCLLTMSSASRAEELGRTLWHGREVNYRVRHGLAIYQGDILLGRADQLSAAASKGEPVQSAAFLTGQANSYLWPSATVPYTVDPAASAKFVASLNQAIQFYRNNTPVKWIPRTTETDYVTFSTQAANLDSCGLSDSIGVLGGQQHIYISLDPACGTGTFTHEMGHAVGLEHEQTRWDRDYYVKVRFENIDKNNAVEYDRDQGQIDVMPYDQGSIMHYGSFDFQRNTLNTIDTIPLGIPIEHRSNLSAIDMEAIRTMYGVPSTTTTVFSTPSGLSLIVDGQTLKMPQTFNWAAGTQHTLALPAGTQPGSTGTRWRFARWSNDGPQSQTITAGPQNRVIGANFAQQFLVAAKTAAGNGGVSINPPSVDGYYDAGTLVTITATPNAGWTFLQWADPTALSTYHGLSSNPAAFTVNYSGFVYNPVFTTAPVTSIPTSIPGTIVQVDGTDVYLPARFAWTAGSTHKLGVAAPVQDSGSVGSPYRWTFLGWGDGGATAHSVVAAAQGSSIAANWQQKYLVSLYTADPQNPYGTSNGSAAFSSPSSDCGNPTPTDCYYNAGTVLTFSATPKSPFIFTNWSGDASGAAPTATAVVNDQLYVTANFAAPGRLVRAGVVNAANYQRQGVAPGEILTIFGLNFGPPQQLTGLQVAGNGITNMLAQTRVLFDGQPAPLVYVQANQISAIVPYAVASKTTTRVVVEYQGKAGNAVQLPVLSSHPGLFTLDSSGSGQVAALNQNYSVNTAANPAPKGSVVILYGTGEGTTSPQGVDGRIVAAPLPAPVLPVKVLIAGREAQVLYFGGAPGLVSGVFQANVVIPLDCPSGLVPISVVVGGNASPALTRVAVQ